VIEAGYGYVDCFGGPDSSLPDVTVDLGDSVRIDIKPPAIKAWPTCSSNHATLTAIERLLTGHHINSAEIVAVDHYGALQPGSGSLRFREVTDPLQAKFCLEYNIAAAFVDGHVTLDSFGGERFARGDLQDFMTRIQRHFDPAAERLVVTLTDGTCRSGLSLDAAAIATEIETLASRLMSESCSAYLPQPDRGRRPRRQADPRHSTRCSAFPS